MKRKSTRKARAAKARAFYAKRHAACGKDVLPAAEAKAMAPWRGYGLVIALFIATAIVGWAATRLFS